jgi:hypothetical protein
MPVTVKHVKGGYRVSTPNGVHAKHTTKAKAEAQERLLNAVEHGWKPTGRAKSAMGGRKGRKRT